MSVKARKVVGDQNSAEFDELRRNFNALLLILQNIAAEHSAGTTTSTQAMTALSTALSTGTDSTSAPHTGTLLTINGVVPTPRHPDRPRVEAQELTTADKL